MRFTLSHAGKGLATLPLVLVAAAAHADYLTAAAGNIGTNTLYRDSQSAYDFGQKPTSSIDLAVSHTTTQTHQTATESASFQVLAEMGRLHAKADTFATHSYTGAYYLGDAAADGGFAWVRPDASQFSVYPNTGPLPFGQPFAGGAWRDVLHVQSASLPVGAPVQFRVHLTLEGSVSGYAPYNYGNQPLNLVTLNSYFGNHGTGFLNLQMSEGTQVLTAEDLVTVSVGEDVEMGSVLGMFSETSYTPGGASYGNVDASNTGIFTLESLTSGVTYTTDSGYRYQAVPEPSAFAVLGLGAMAFLRRRRKA